MKHRPHYSHNTQFIETERFNEFMTQVYDALSAEIQAAMDEIASLVSAIVAHVEGTSDAQLQVLVDKLTTSVDAAKSATAPVPAPAPVTPTPVTV